MVLNSGELRDLWKRMQIAKETAEDCAVLIGHHDRDQAARLTNIAKEIEAEIGIVAQKAEAARKAEKGRQQ